MDSEGAEGDGSVCRICRTSEGFLHQPCKCSGSIAFAHQECLEQWISVARKKGTCELCGYQFRFKKVYKEGTPERLPTNLIVLQALKTALKAVIFLGRLFVCGIVWLGLVPWLCIWSLRFSFWIGRMIPAGVRRLLSPIEGFARWYEPPLAPKMARNATEAVMTAVNETMVEKRRSWLITIGTENFVVRTVRHIVTDPNLTHDTFLGQMVAISAVLIFFGVFLLHEWVMQHAHLVNNEANRPAHQPLLQPPAQPMNVPAPPIEQPAAQAQIDEPAAAQQPDPLPGDFPFTFEAPPSPAEREEGLRQRRPFATREGAGLPEDFNFTFEAPQPLPGPVVEPPAQPIALAPQPVVEPAIPPLGALAPDDHADDMDEDFGAEGDDFFALDDIESLLTAIGIKGPFHGLFANAGIILFLFFTISTGFIAIPYLAGRLVVTTGMLKSAFSFPLASICYLTDPFVDLGVSAYRYFRPMPKPSPDIYDIFPSMGLMDLMNERVAALGKKLIEAGLRRPPPPPPPPTFFESCMAAARAFVQHHNARLSSFYASLGANDQIRDRIGNIAIGYMMVAAGLLFMHRFPRTFGSPVQMHVKRIGLVGKALLFGLIEVFLFPFLCGTAVSFISLPLFPDTTAADRLAYFLRAPLSAVYLTWAAGSLEMFVFAGWLSLCREGLRPGAMFFIRDPQDMENDPLHDFITVPMANQVRKLVKSLFLYWTSIAVGLGPVAYWISQAVPLRWQPASPLSPIPYELLFVQFVIPLIQRTIRWQTLGESLKRGLEMIAAQLCLSSFLFDRHYVSEQKRGGGGYALVPKIDSFRVDGERPAVIRADSAGQPLSDEGKRRYEMAKENYKLVHLPSWFKMRIALALYTLWAISAWLIIALPISLMRLGRLTFGLIGLEPHDTYSALLGFFLFWILGITLRGIREIPRMLKRLQPVRSLRFGKSLIRAGIWVRSFVCMVILLPLLVAIFVQTHLLCHFNYTASEMPTFAVGYSWTLGVLIVATAERILYYFAPTSFYGSRIIMVHAAFIPAANGQRRARYAGQILLWTLILSHIIPRLLACFAQMAVSLLLVHATIGITDVETLRFYAAGSATGNLIIMAWYGSEPWRKQLQQQTLDDAFLVERRLLDRADDATTVT